MYYLCDFSANADPFKHINAGLGFDKENYAALASFGFTLIFAGVSLFAGGVADTYDRNRVTAASCAVWYVTDVIEFLSASYHFSSIYHLRCIVLCFSSSFLHVTHSFFITAFQEYWHSITSVRYQFFRFNTTSIGHRRQSSILQSCGLYPSLGTFP